MEGRETQPSPGHSLQLNTDPAMPLPPTAAVPPPVPAGGRPGALIANRYEIEEALGEGGMGAVYRVFDRHLKRHAALKMILAHKRDAKRDTRFLHEARAMARLQHPGCVQVHDVGVTEEGAPFLVMELVTGEPLSDVIARGDLRAGHAALLLHQVAGALHCAHGLGIVHRDVKPPNILVGTGGAKLADFGIAKDEEASTNVTAAGHMIGTLSYMPPEQLGGAGDVVDARSDVYALGGTLYECLVGRPPFVGSKQALITAILETEPTPPRSLVAEVPRDLEVVALKCLRKAKEHRYQSALELQEDLGRYLAGEPVRARTPSLWERAWVWTRRHRKLVLTGVAVAVVVGGAAGGLFGARVARDRSAARTGMELGEGLFAAGKLEEAEKAFAEAARLDTPYAGRARERALEARAWKLVAEGEACFQQHLSELKKIATDRDELLEAEHVKESPEPFATSEAKQAYVAKVAAAAERKRRAEGLLVEAETDFRRALTIVPDPKIASRFISVLEKRHDVLGEVVSPEESERIARQVDALASQYGVPNPLVLGQVEVATGPVACKVRLYRYLYDPKLGVERPCPWSPRSGVGKPAEPTETDYFPLAPAPADGVWDVPAMITSLATGEYLAVCEAPGVVTARMPFQVRRKSRQSLVITVYPSDILGPRTSEFAYVPWGWARRGPNLELLDLVENDYFVMRREVTFGEWKEFWEANGRAAAVLPRAEGGRAPTERLETLGAVAVRGVTRSQALFFAAWYGKAKLHSPAAWDIDLPKFGEYYRALRGPLHRDYPWGNTFDAGFCAGSFSVPRGDLPRVGAFLRDQSLFGITDLGGSAREWVRDLVPFNGWSQAAGGCSDDGASELFDHLRHISAWLSPTGAADQIGFRLVVRHN